MFDFVPAWRPGYGCRVRDSRNQRIFHFHLEADGNIDGIRQQIPRQLQSTLGF